MIHGCYSKLVLLRTDPQALLTIDPQTLIKITQNIPTNVAQKRYRSFIQNRPTDVTQIDPQVLLELVLKFSFIKVTHN